MRFVPGIGRAVVAVVLALFFGLSAAAAGPKTVHVKGYTKKDGTHVATHERKTPEKKSPAATSTKSTRSKIASAQLRDEKGRFVRSESAKFAFMKQTGYPTGRPGYVIDHIISLACGGADNLSNMQWQTVAEAKAKDKVERRGCR